MSKLVNSFQQAPSFQHALTRRNVGEGREDVYRCVKEKIRLNIIGGALHQTIFKVEHDEMPSEIYRSAVCGSRIITASRDGCIYCVDVDQRRLPWSYQAISPRALFYDDFETIDFYITEDKEKLVCPSYAYERHKIDILRFEDGACLTSLMNVDALKVALVSGLIFNQQECIDGRKLFVWNTDGNEIADFKWENLPAFSCKPFSYDGRILISQDSQLISFDRNGAEIKRMILIDRIEKTALDGSRLACSFSESNGDLITLIDLCSWKILQDISFQFGKEGYILDMVMQGNWICLKWIYLPTSHFQAWAINTVTKEQLLLLDKIDTIADFALNDQQLIITLWPRNQPGSKIMVWDLAAGARLVRKWRCEERIKSLVFREGRLFAEGRNSVRVWDFNGLREEEEKTEVKLYRQ